jgi:hypothetical protein
MSKSLKILTDDKKSYFLKSKHAIYLSLGLHESSTLKREHLALQNMEFLNFLLGYFSPSVSGTGSGTSQPKSKQIQADPDPQHWMQVSPKSCWRSY